MILQFQLAEILKDLNTTAEFQHTPWGLPGLKHDSFQNSTVNVLYQPRFTTAFDTINMLPIWVSQTLNYSQVYTANVRPGVPVAISFLLLFRVLY